MPSIGAKKRVSFRNGSLVAVVLIPYGVANRQAQGTKAAQRVALTLLAQTASYIRYTGGPFK